MAGFGTFAPGSSAMQGLAMLRGMRGMQGGGAPAMPGAMPEGMEGMPDFMQRGLVGRVMSGNPGGLIGAILKNRNAPVNPGLPPVAGSPDYVEGGAGPMAGGGAGGMMGGMMNGMGGMGMLSKLLQGLGGR